MRVINFIYLYCYTLHNVINTIWGSIEYIVNFAHTYVTSQKSMNITLKFHNIAVIVFINTKTHDMKKSGRNSI